MPRIYVRAKKSLMVSQIGVASIDRVTFAISLLFQITFELLDSIKH